MAASGLFRRWFGAFRSEEYPRWTVFFLAIFLAGSIGMTWIVLVALPHERAIANHGALASAHAKTYITHEYRRHTRITTFHADLTWLDGDGHPRSYDNLIIGEDAYDQITEDQGDTRIRYDAADPTARPIVVSDIGHRELEQDYAMALWAASVVGLLLGLVYFRRRLREWRAHQGELANPQKPWWFG